MRSTTNVLGPFSTGWAESLLVVPDKMALAPVVLFNVVRCGPVGRKRKRWTVQRSEQYRPACYQVGNKLYAHPDLVTKLRHQLGAG